jgi:hypothetical protein
VYCTVTIVVERKNFFGVVFLPFLPVVRHILDRPVRRIAREFLEEHWRVKVQRWKEAQPEEDTVADLARSISIARVSSPLSDHLTANNLSPETFRVGHLNLGAASLPPNVDPETPEVTPRTGETPLAQPSLTKSMQFWNGWLYKLGDGLLNSTWNQRYFILIGSALQYFRSPHEARPRDVYNLTGAHVEWVKDQTRPFAFTVTVSTHRPLYLSGESWKDTSEWVERIQIASKEGHPDVRSQVHAAGVAHRRASKSLSAVHAPEPSPSECALQACAQALKDSVQAVQVCGDGYRIRAVQNGLRIFEHKQDCRSSGDGRVSIAEVGVWLIIVALILPWVFRLCPTAVERLLQSSASISWWLALPCSLLLASYYGFTAANLR